MMGIDELRARLDRLDARFDKLDESLKLVTSSVLGLQHNSLRLLGAGSLLGGCVIYVLARAVGLG